MGPTVTAKTDPKPAARPLPADVADVALIAADPCAAIGAMSVSWWHSAVAAKRAYSTPSRTPIRSDGGQHSTVMADSVPR